MEFTKETAQKLLSNCKEFYKITDELPLETHTYVEDIVVNIYNHQVVPLIIKFLQRRYDNMDIEFVDNVKWGWNDITDYTNLQINMKYKNDLLKLIQGYGFLVVEKTLKYKIKDTDVYEIYWK